ncbi:hypothetical protein [Pedobacter sp. B4-66]|uniref:hypothetical protein n=1 Tax=Pedobacter sp. B4-66 TaxID=2817280 RepID=UPI001BDA8AC9|nr:hypothetical protein [Pedobacter sp. B4-66]
MRTKINILLTSALIITAVLFSCNNISESIQRDIFISPKPVAFTIPKISDTDSIILIKDINTKSLNLDSLINGQVDKFGAKNIKNIKIKDFKLALLDTNSLNNIQNIETIIVTIKASGQDSLIIARTNPSASKAAKLTIPLVSGISDLKGFLTSPSFNYKLTGILRTATTKELKAEITATYTVTVGL